MTVRRNTVKVTIVGGEYTLKTETSPEHTQAVAAYVDRAIGETMESEARLEIHKAAILAALRIAGELFEARAEASRLSARIDGLAEEIRPWLPPAKRRD
ncbi:MAG: cell division protein ZapA [Gemmatimonadaceae bacterium]